MAARSIVLFGTMLILVLLFEFSDSSAVFKIEMKRFKNLNAKLYNFNGCDESNGICEHIFTFCLDHYLGNDNPHSCFYTKRISLFFASNDISFGATIPNGIANPIVINVARWEGAVMLKVDVWESDNDGDPHDYVDQMHEFFVISPAKTSSQARWQNRKIYGMRQKDKTTLDVRYTAYCGNSYYGPHCDVECLPSDDDVTGHYTCDEDTGQIVCLPGWRSLETGCKESADDCVDHNCQNGASCVDGHLTYNCSCPSGFSGSTCETNIDECESNPCGNNGCCLDKIDGYECNCSPLFTGIHCETDRYICVNNNPCENNGFCLDIDAGYKCVCPPLFTGVHCETGLDECQSNPCENNGCCVDEDDGYECICPPIFMGDHCELAKPRNDGRKPVRKIRP